MAAPNMDAPPGLAGPQGRDEISGDDELNITARRGDSKALAKLQARAALAGFSLAELSDGDFIVHRWNLHRALPDLRAVAVFLARLEGHHHG